MNLTINLTVLSLPLNHVPKCPIYMSFKYHQEWSLLHFPGQPVPMAAFPVKKDSLKSKSCKLRLFPFVLSFVTGDKERSEMVLFQDIWNRDHGLCRNAGTTCSWASRLSTHFGATSTVVIVVGKLEKSTVDWTAQTCFLQSHHGRRVGRVFQKGQFFPFSYVCLQRALSLPCEGRVREKAWPQSPAAVR